MTWFVKAFLKSSLAWLALGVTFGVAMAAHPVWTVYRLAHVHMMLLGFVTMMIYGVAYHVIPHFVGFCKGVRRLGLTASHLELCPSAERGRQMPILQSRWRISSAMTSGPS